MKHFNSLNIKAAFVVLLILSLLAVISNPVSAANGFGAIIPLILDDDIDNDGLEDDEEAINGTDPNNSDTDGDGIEDGLEVFLGLDPLDPNGDADGDGILDADEIAQGLDPTNADSDGDGVNDPVELANGTDPIDPDTDNDGLNDGGEAAAGTDPHNTDTDGDTLLDGFEVNMGLDPLDANGDADGDGLSDVNEVAQGLDPTLADSDGDGIDDPTELANGTNPLNRDIDFDGIPDGSDACFLDPDNSTDGDTICFAADNCPLVANENQADADGDGIGDACDTFNSTTVADSDGDGIGDDVDNCPQWPNADQMAATTTSGRGKNRTTSPSSIGSACTCADLNGSGTVTKHDLAVFDNALSIAGESGLALNQLERCDVNADGVCTVDDRNMIEGHVNKKSRTPLTQVRCPSLDGAANQALNKLGYGFNNWSRERIRLLQLNAVDRTTNGYAGLDAYIAEQLDPGNTIDPEFFEKSLPYSTEGPAHNIVAPFATTGQTQGYLRINYAIGSGTSIGLDNRNRTIGNTSELKILRASYSRRQLDAVLRDFWFNHFNIFGFNSLGRWAIAFHEESIADAMYGKFEDVVMAQTKTAGMLDYLDLDDNKVGARNENFARELVELHTLGVSRDIDGVRQDTYDWTTDASAQNIIEVSRILTGWGYNNSAGGSNGLGFVFTSNDHENGDKSVQIGGPSATPWNFGTSGNESCGNVLYGPEEEEGRALICRLSRHPMSADNVGNKLIKRFLGDSAEGQETILLNAFKQTWMNTAADLPGSLQTLLVSDAFKRSLYYEDNKVKRPHVFNSSLIRALGPDVEGPSNIVDQPYVTANFNASFRALMGDFMPTGEGLYLAPHPIGYSEESTAWIGVSVMLNHFNAVSRLLNSSNPNELADLQSIKMHLGLQLSYADMSDLVRDILAGTGIDLPESSIAEIADFANRYDDSETNPDEQVKRALIGVLSTPEFMSH